MRHAIGRPRYVTVASWLTAAGVGLAVGTFGVGGLINHAADRDDGGDLELAAAPASAGPGAGPRGGDVTAEGARSPSSIPEGPDPTGRPSTYVPFRPTEIRLPSGDTAPVDRAGVHDDGALEIPDDPERVGWWTGGAQAGEPYGTIVLAGHVDSRRYGLGVLAEMLTMRPGQTVRLGDAVHTQKYLVRTIRKVEKARLTADTGLFDQQVPHRLVLITCGGPFDLRTHRYRDNIVLVADPVD